MYGIMGPGMCGWMFCGGVACRCGESLEEVQTTEAEGKPRAL